jgi:transketolase
VELLPGRDVTIVVSGGTVFHAVDAAKSLALDGIDAGVVNVHTLKPIDADMIVRSADTTGRIVTVEDHNIIGGLGSAVAEVIAENGAGKLTRHGLRDVFGESGSPEALYRKYRLDAPGIAAVVREALG